MAVFGDVMACSAMLWRCYGVRRCYGVMAVFGDVMAVLWCSAMLWRCYGVLWRCYGGVRRCSAMFGEIMTGPG